MSVKPIAFMVMPFRKRPVPNPPPGAPAEVDFDRLWDNGIRPALELEGFLPVRADSEAGSVIVKDMLERLAFSHLVLADMTLPNGNVYYEVGIRHVAQKTACVLIAADWSRQLFDVEQFRSLRYPLTDGSVPDEAATKICAVLRAKIAEYKNSLTPYHELVTRVESSTVFRDQLETISAFQTLVRAARLERDSTRKREKVLELMERYQGSALELREVAFELLTLVRDTQTWEALLDFIQRLPTALREHSFTKEQALLAKSKRGDHFEAIAGLEELIALEGDSAERRGLIGGRYKRLWRAARDTRAANSEPDLIELGHLDDAIKNYRLGMILDLNEYFCATNLPGLLRARQQPGDAEEAAFIDRLVVLATQTKIGNRTADEWARPTLLGTAFRVGNVAGVTELARQVAQEGHAAWKLESTLNDINDAVNATPDPGVKAKLTRYRDQLAALLPTS